MLLTLCSRDIKMNHNNQKVKVIVLIIPLGMQFFFIYFDGSTFTPKSFYHPRGK